MDGTLLNKFLVGADPEMVLMDPPQLINGLQAHKFPTANFYGWDHQGFVLEPHPVPSCSVREVIKNTRKSLHVIGHQFDRYKFRAGAYLTTPQRVVTLGGHVHLDLPKLSNAQITAMDVFSQNLEDLDILPKTECQQRQERGEYGRKSDIRSEHGHVEYRSMCSWLFSQKTSMLCMTGIKLAAIAPETIQSVDSYKALLKWLEDFKGKDDDVDWILDKDYLKVSSSMTAKPDNNIKSVWRINNDKGALLFQQAHIQDVAPVPAPYEARIFNRPGYIRRYMAANGDRPSLFNVNTAQQEWDNLEIRRVTVNRNMITNIEAQNQMVERANALIANAPIEEDDPFFEADDE